jgi:sialidase-1
MMTIQARFLATIVCLVGLSSAVEPLLIAAEPEVVLRLQPSQGNPRNSEGDFVQLADGRILFVYTRFTGGGGDHDHASLVSRVSTDGGKTWSDEDKIVVANEGEWNVMSVSLLRLADGRVALFYLRKNSLTDCRPLVRFSTDEARRWSDPVAIIPDEQIGYHVLNNDRVVQLSSGRLVVPVSLHNRPGWAGPDWNGEITCYLSDDGGTSWRRSQTAQKAHGPNGKRIVAQEPGVVELKDGRVLLWIRTNAGEQYRSFSTDGGETCSALHPMGIASPVSPATIERIPTSGDLLLVWNDHSHLPLSQRQARTPLSIAISRDEGATWDPAKALEDDANGWYCYTAMAFADDHVLLGHCAGDRRTGGLNVTQISRVPIGWLYE